MGINMTSRREKTEFFSLAAESPRESQRCQEKQNISEGPGARVHSGKGITLIRPVPQPVLAKRTHPRERFAVLLSIRGGLAGNDVVEVANGKSFDFHPPAPRVGEPFDPVRSEDQVQIKRTVL